jgi:hypothetical protein
MSNNSVVYTDSQIDILSLNKILYERLSNRPYWNFTENGEPVLFDNGIRKNKEPRILEPSLLLEENRRHTTPDPLKTWKELKGFRDIMKERAPTDEELKQYLKIVKDSLYIIQYQKSNGETKWMPGRAKGTKTYNKELRKRLEDFANLIPQSRYDVIFLNFTCDPKLYRSRADAWQNFKKRNVDPTLEHLRKHCAAFYEGVMESHANGYPHCHYVVWLPKGMFTELKKVKNGKEIKYGLLYQTLRKRIPNKIFKVIKAGGDRVVGYICKYISKGIENDIFSALTTEGELTKTQRKEIIEFLALKAFQRRKAYLQQDKATKERLKELQQKRVSVSQSEARERAPLNATELRSHLIEICTKSPLRFYKIIYSMSYGAFIERYQMPPQYVKDIPELIAEDFRKNSNLIYNSHSFYNDFVNFLFDWENSPLNRKFFWGDDINNYSRMCDGYDFNNDEEWLECITKVFDFYATKILIEKNEYSKVLRGMENLTDRKKTWSYWRKGMKRPVEFQIESNNELDRFYQFGEYKKELEEKHRKIQIAIAENLRKIHEAENQN